MKPYHKIQTVFNRDPANKHKTVIEGEFSRPEFEYLSDNEWVFTEKVDGTNIRIHWNGVNRRFGGKTDNAQIPAFLYERLENLFTNENLKNALGGDECDFTLYGEGYGARIQKGGGNYNSEGVNFVLFDVLAGDYWLNRTDVLDIAGKLSCEIIPVVGKGTLRVATEMARWGIISKWGEFSAEGLVMRPEVELKNRGGQRIISKIKCKDFK